MRGRFGNKARLTHILEAINEIESYLDKADFDVFVNNSMMKFACIKQLEIIGEATHHITDAIKLKYPQVEWLQIVGLRNFLIHEYFGVDLKIVWEILQADIVIFKSHILQIVEGNSDFQ
jgi:uncharacterized protein with HEPN domain